MVLGGSRVLENGNRAETLKNGPPKPAFDINSSHYFKQLVTPLPRVFICKLEAGTFPISQDKP